MGDYAGCCYAPERVTPFLTHAVWGDSGVVRRDDLNYNTHIKVETLFCNRNRC